jgi:protein required for attachment to host cells
MTKIAKHANWILICDASHAHFYREDAGRTQFTHLETLEHGDSRAHVRDLTADAQGRKPNGTPGGMGSSMGGDGGTGHTYMGRPGASQENDAKEVEAQKFARELAGRLERGLNDNAYEGLVLIAPPHFLGLMKSTVSTQVSKHIEETIDKDLSTLDGPRREERLRELRKAD